MWVDGELSLCNALLLFVWLASWFYRLGREDLFSLTENCLQRAENQTLSWAAPCCDVYRSPLHCKIREIWRFSNKLHLFCPVKYQFPDCFMTADAAHNSDCNLHLCFIQPDDVENTGGYRAWNMVCSWNDSGCGCWLNYTDEGELCTAFCILRSSCFCVRMQLVNPWESLCLRKSSWAREGKCAFKYS